MGDLGSCARMMKVERAGLFPVEGRPFLTNICRTSYLMAAVPGEHSIVSRDARKAIIFESIYGIRPWHLLKEWTC